MKSTLQLFAVVLCSAVISTGAAAHAQQSSTVVRSGAVTTVPSGMSFAFDADRNQITSSGLALKPAVTGRSNVTPTTGMIDVTIMVKVASLFPAGTTFRCTVYAIGGILNLDNGSVQGGVETASGNAKSLGVGTQSCTLTIPYSWTLTGAGGADSGLILAYGVAAVAPTKEIPRSTLQVDGVENLPATGTISRFAFDVTL